MADEPRLPQALREEDLHPPPQPRRQEGPYQPQVGEQGGRAFIPKAPFCKLHSTLSNTINERNVYPIVAEMYIRRLCQQFPPNDCKHPLDGDLQGDLVILLMKDVFSGDAEHN